MASLATAQSATAGLESAVSAGFSWQTIVQLLIQYGPMVIALIMKILPFILAGGSRANALAWIVQAAEAAIMGQPEPPLPT